MTSGSPRRFFSASRGSVTGRREASAGTVMLRMVDMRVDLLFDRMVDALRQQGRHRRVDVDDGVRVLRDMDDPGLVALQLRLVVLPVADDDDRVAAVDEPRG